MVVYLLHGKRIPVLTVARKRNGSPLEAVCANEALEKGLKSREWTPRERLRRRISCRCRAPSIKPDTEYCSSATLEESLQSSRICDCKVRLP